MAGGNKFIDLNDESRDNLNFALIEFNKRNDASNQFTFINSLDDSIINISHQVVAGSKYTFNVRLNSSVGNQHIYKFVVWSQPWKQYQELLEAVEINQE